MQNLRDKKCFTLFKDELLLKAKIKIKLKDNFETKYKNNIFKNELSFSNTILLIKSILFYKIKMHRQHYFIGNS